MLKTSIQPTFNIGPDLDLKCDLNIVRNFITEIVLLLMFCAPRYGG